MASKYAGGITVPESIARALVLWRSFVLKNVLDRVEDNMSGRMMERRSGKAYLSVLNNTRTIPNGVSFRTRSPYLIAWMEGSPRKAFFVAPKKPGGLLAWKDKKTGEWRFSRGHLIPAWRFTPKRPVIEEAITYVRPAFEKYMRVVIEGAMGKLFPDVTERASINLGGKG